MLKERHGVYRLPLRVSFITISLYRNKRDDAIKKHPKRIGVRRTPAKHLQRRTILSASATFMVPLRPQGASQSASMILICPAVYWVSLMTMSLILATSWASRPFSPASTTTLQDSEPMNTTQSA